jgi:hypothetical protein
MWQVCDMLRAYPVQYFLRDSGLAGAGPPGDANYERDGFDGHTRIIPVPNLHRDVLSVSLVAPGWFSRTLTVHYPWAGI